MILGRSADDGTLGHWHMGSAELLLNAGHNEYSIDAVAKPIAVTAYSDESEGMEEMNHDWLPELAQPYVEKLDIDGWETVYLLEGPVVEIARAFYRLAMDLDPSMDPTNYTPGGDDDTFDYWPSGMTLLYQLACDLDELTAAKRGEVGCTCGTPPFAPPEASDDCPFHGRRAPNPSGDRYIERYRQVLGEALDREVPEIDWLPEFMKVKVLARRWVARR